MTRRPSKQVLDRQYKDWLKLQPKKLASIDTKKFKSAVLKELRNYHGENGIEDYTLFHKWEELKDIKERFPEEVIQEVYNNIWIPKGISDYRRLHPELVEIRNLSFEAIDFFGNPYNVKSQEHDKLNDHWVLIRTLISSQTYDGSVGRSIRFLVRDKVSQKYLGAICISSDLFAITPRNQDLKITQKQWEKLIDHSANGSTIIPCQPFGTRYLGGKLLALLCLSNDVSDAWERKYGKKLVSVTTTSLWRNKKPFSQYDGMGGYWKNLGETSGSSALKPSKKLYEMMRQWMKQKYPYEYWQHYEAKGRNGMLLLRENKNRAIIFCMKKLGIDRNLYMSNHQRGIYYARLYKNTDDFFSGKISSSELIRKEGYSVEELTHYWRYGGRGDKYNKEKKHFHASMTKGRIDKQLLETTFEKNEQPDWYLLDADLTFEELKIKRRADIGR